MKTDECCICIWDEWNWLNDEQQNLNQPLLMCCYVYKKLATYLTKHVALALVLFSRKRRYICLFNIQTTLEGSHEPSPIQCYMYIYNLLQLCITKLSQISIKLRRVCHSRTGSDLRHVDSGDENRLDFISCLYVNETRATRWGSRWTIGNLTLNKGTPCPRMPKPAMPSSQARPRAADLRHGPAANLRWRLSSTDHGALQLPQLWA